MSVNRISGTQSHIWFDQQLNKTSAMYNLGGYIVIEGPLDTDAFSRAVSLLGQSQEALSFSFAEAEGVPVCCRNEVRPNLFFYDFSEYNDDYLDDWIKTDFSEPFDTAVYPLYKFALIKRAPAVHIWYAKMHHIIADGASFRLLFNQVLEYYRQLAAGIMPEVALRSYSPYTAEYLTYTASARFEADKKYWVQRFASLPAFYYKPVPYADAETAPVSVETYISADRKKALQAFASACGVSVFTLFSGMIALFFSRFTRNADIVLGVPVMNRGSRFHDVIGVFINVLPVRLGIDAAADFPALLKMIRREMLASLRHQQFQQADLLRYLEKKPAYNRLYEIRVSYESFLYDADEKVQRAAIKTLSNGMEQDPVSVHIMDYENSGLTVRTDFNSGYVKNYEIEQFTAAFEAAMQQVPAAGDTPLSSIPLLSPEDSAKLTALSQGPLRAGNGECFLSCWERVVKDTPGSTVLGFAGQSFSAAEADGRANALAAAMAAKGVVSGSRVAIYLQRSAAVITAMLAVMKCGAVFVPLDTDYPADRLSYMLSDSGCTHCIADDAGAALLQHIIVIDIAAAENSSGDFVPAVKTVAEHPAYIIYTSGSTGRPKGVVVSNRAMFDYIQTFTAYFGITRQDTVLQQSSFCFDTCIEEIFPVLGAGGRLVVAAYRTDINYLLQLMQQERVTVLSTNPYVVEFLNNVYRPEAWKELRIVISGGDVLKPSAVSSLANHLAVYNTYGPTEATVCAAYYRVPASIEGPIPIGRPIANKSIYITDDYGNLQPVGAPGEICIGGEGLASGYLNRPEETKKAFGNIAATDKPVYKTGDLGMWTPDGVIQFCGRKDRQMSINGYRIEPGEIENCLLAAEGVSGCIVDACDLQGHKAIAAFLVADEQHVPREALKNRLSAQLPPSMMPAVFVYMDAFPLLPGGKVDMAKLKALPLLKTEDMAYEPAAGAVEEKLYAIWVKLLKQERIGRNNNFFELGGHSLLANQCVSLVREAFAAELSLKEFYDNPTLKQLAVVVGKNAERPGRTYKIDPAPAGALIPLSYPQERIWFLNQLDKNNKAYIVPRALKMTGTLRVDIVRETFTQLVERHEILRTVFRTIEGVPYQFVKPPFSFEVPVLDFKGFPESARSGMVNRFILDEGNREFDLQEGPLLRAYVLALTDEESILVVCEHHLIHDGWTQGVLLNEFIQLYAALVQHQPSPLPPLPLQFGDFAYWQRQTFNELTLKDTLDYWKKKLTGVTGELNLPFYQPRPPLNSGNGALIEAHIDPGLVDRLNAFCRQHDITLFMLMLGVFKVLLHKYSGNTDICIATGVANRRIKEMDNMLGMVINTIALRTEIDPESSLAELLQVVKQVCLEGYEHEDAPFGEVVKAVNPARTLAALPIAQYMFSFMNTPTRNIELPDCSIEIVDAHNLSAKFDINIVVVIPREDAFNEAAGRAHDDIIVEWEYNSDIFDKDTMQRMLSAYMRLMNAAAEIAGKKVNEISVLSPDEDKLIMKFSDPHGAMPEAAAAGTASAAGLLATVHSLIEAHAAVNPDRPAITCGATMLTYGELNKTANRLAACLQSAYRIEADVPVCIRLPRTEQLVIAMLAVLKAGGAYIPVDPAYPDERTGYIIENSGSRLVIDEEMLGKLREQEASFSGENLTPGAGPGNLAYIIYTSGSTGRPKGVMVEHRSAVSFFRNIDESFAFAEDIVFGATTNFTFDISVLELLGTLTRGLHCRLLPSGDAAAVLACLEEGTVNALQVTPSMLDQLIEAAGGKSDMLSRLKLLIVGGEALSFRAWKLLKTMSGVNVYNAYGPTETTIWSACADIHKSSGLSVGSPLPEEYVLILGADGRLAPIGVTGEIYIGGNGLARGYCGNAALTAERFVQNPLCPQLRVYRTGDLGRWRADGSIGFVGRTDDQVKIRGYRIEPAEIEAALMGHPAVEKAVVTAWSDKNGSRELAAYITCAESEADTGELRKYLLKKLPGYMIPANFIRMERLPLTFSGKIDRKALPDPAENIIGTGTAYQAPQTAAEHKLVQIWEEVLGRAQIGVNDNFFDLGGHSLKATRIMAKIENTFGLHIDLKELFTEPTISYLASYIETVSWHGSQVETAEQGADELIL